MTFEHGKKIFSIRFAYIGKNGRRGAGGLRNLHNARVTTICEIETRDKLPDGEIVYTVHYKGSSKRDPKDLFSKVVGREMALLNTCKSINDRELRKKIWQTFKDNCKTHFKKGK